MHKFNFKAVVIIAFLLLGAGFLNAQVKIGNNPQTINPASLLELESIDKAFVINRVNTAQMNAILPLEGAMVYNTEEQCLHYYDGLQWINICEAFGENLSFTSEALENPGNFESISITKTTDTNYNFEVGLLNASNIQDGTMGTTKLVDGAVTQNKLADNAVSNAKIQNGAIQPGKMAAGLPNTILQTNASSFVEWAPLNVDNVSGKLLSNELVAGTGTDNSIIVTNGDGATLKDTQIRVADAGITNVKLGPDAVTTDKILNETILSEDILDGTIAEVDVADDAITNAKLADDAVNTAEIVDDAVTTEKIGTTAGDENKILGTSATGDPEWQDAATIAANLGEDVTSTNGSITGTALDAALVAMDLEVNVDGTTLQVDAVNGVQVADDGINSAKILNETVQSEDILDGTIADADLLDRTITPSKLADGTTAGEILRYDGTDWVLADQSTLAITEVDGIIGNEVTGVTNPTLTLSGAGSNVDPLTLAVSADGITENELADNAVSTDKILDANVTDDKLDKAGISLTGFAVPTADLSVGTFKLTDVADPTLDQDAATKIYVDTQITGSNALADATIFIGDATGTAQANTITGDATLTNTGFLEIEDDAITTVKILDANVTDEKLNKAGISLTGFAVPTADLSIGSFKLTDVADPTLDQDAATKIYVDTQITGSNALTDANIFIGDGSGIAQPNTITGDATLTNTGFLEIEDDAITTVKILDANVTDEKLNKAGISLTGFAVPTADLSVGTFKLTDVADPTLDQDAATKIYVDTQITGSNALADATIFIGDGSGIAQPNTITGDATLTNTGFLEIEDNVITATNLNADVAGAGLENDATTNALNVLVDNTTIEIDATNGLQVIDNSIGTSKIEDNSIVDADVNAGAAIDGSKINPVFTDNVSTTGTLSTTGTATIGANTITNVDGTVGQILTTDGAGAATWQDPATSIPMGTAGSIFFSDGASGLVENNTELFWDSTNNRFGIGTNAPTNKFQVTGAIRSQGFLNSNGSTTEPSYRFGDDTNTGMSRPAADEIGFSVGGIEALNIDETSGNTSVIVREKLKLEGTLEDANSSVGTAGQVLTSTATGTEWKAPAVVAMGMVNQAANGSTTPPLASSPTKENGAVTSKISTGYYRVTFITGNTRADRLYTIQLTLLGSTGTASTIRVYAASLATAPTTTQFEVETLNSAGARVDSSWYYTVTDF
ncbi:hypothetical protein Celal_2280 [Cellulophaga algicola DSM 14237]|uniref:Uncharacterized protein n=1 Tax=Cellulophaga algicola (strain DSM 14237 / IC166 / ACAM 630) TaxID=688270 RepID=E6X6N4_CELAD|nr:hypothetical protein [Cellulophaga algicola]ADV49572.1 hypothetical protein Celal_2280 [Cellulophaga algicola DSM 14237]